MQRKGVFKKGQVVKYILILTLLFISASVGAVTVEDMSEARKQAEFEARAIDKICWNEAFKDKPDTTRAMWAAAVRNIDCLYQEIEKQVKLAFLPQDHEKMIALIHAAGKNIADIYFEMHTGNRYCYGHCGTMNNITHTVNEMEFLIGVLTDLILMNRVKDSV